MDLDDFHKQIDRRLAGSIDIEPADAAHAVLTALARRLTAEEATELASELPEELGDVLAEASGELEFARDEFIEDVASRLDLDDVDAEQVAIVTLGVVRSAIEQRATVEQVIESLPTDLAQLMHAGD